MKKTNIAFLSRGKSHLHRILAVLVLAFAFGFTAQAQYLAPSKAVDKVEEMKQNLLTTISNASTSADQRIVDQNTNADLTNSVRVFYYNALLVELKKAQGQGNLGEDTFEALERIYDRFELDPNLPQSRMNIVTVINQELHTALQQ